MSRQLSEMTPSALNMTAFPQNRRKRHLHSPNSPNGHTKQDMQTNSTCNDNDSSNIPYSSCSTPVAHHTLTKSTKILKNNAETASTSNNNNNNNNNISNAQRVSLRRSTGLLNLSLETSPSTQRVINNFSKNDEMLKSFNELTFNSTNTSSLDPKDPLSVAPTTSTASSSSSSTMRAKTAYKPTRVKYSSIFGTHNINNISHVSTSRRGSDMQKKLERQLEHYKDKLSKKISPTKNELSPSRTNDKAQQQAIKKTKSFALSKFLTTNPAENETPNKPSSTHTHPMDIYDDELKYVKSSDKDTDLDLDLDLMVDDTSPSKYAVNKLPNSMIMSNSASISNRPITTGSISMSNSSSIATFNSNSMVPPSTIPTSTSNTAKFATPAAFKSIKPLQTAFTSTGLQSKSGLNTIRKSKHTVPETPCKKPPRVVDIDSIKSKNKSAPPTANTSSSSATSTLKNSKNIMFNHSSTPKSMNSSFNSTANETSYTKNSYNMTENTTMSKHSHLSKNTYTNSNTNNNINNNPNINIMNTQFNQTNVLPAVNTSDLQQCLLKFTNEFDDLYNEEENSNLSIFTSSTHSQNVQHNTSSGHNDHIMDLSKNMHIVNDQDTDDDDDVKMWDEAEKLPTTPREKLHMPINLSSVKSVNDNSNMNTPESFNSIGSNASYSSGSKLNDTPTRRVGFSYKSVNNNANNNIGGTSMEVSSSGSSYWQRANSRNPSVQSLYPRGSTSSVNLINDNNGKVPVFAPPNMPVSLMVNIPNGNGGHDKHSPHTPVDLMFNKPSRVTDSRSGSIQSNGSDMIASTPVYMHESKSTLKDTYSASTETLLNNNGVPVKENPEIDNHLFSKFGNCTLLGKGEFSIVYEVQFEGIKYAVKRTKQRMPGPKTRLRKLEEVEILKSLRRVGEYSDYNNSNGSEYVCDDGSEAGGSDSGNDIIIDHNDGRDYVLTLISAWEIQSHLYIMTDYCENGSLDQFLINQCEISRSRLDEWRVWKILVEVMMGLKWIHSHNILHLDLKPANIFITFDGTLKIGDFGVGVKLPIPTFFDREGDREYIAPEIISKHEYGYAADIFSVGLIMVEVAANVILPDNGTPWQKLRSGDLTDAGRLSSSDLSDCNRFMNSNMNGDSIFSDINGGGSENTIKTELSNMSYSSFIKGKLNKSGVSHGCNNGGPNNNNNMLSMMNLESWIPYWFYDGNSTLDKLVSWMINPNPEERPSSEQILQSWECGLVELRRKSGATIYEGDYGPVVNREEMAMETGVLSSRGCYRLGDVV